MPSQARLDYLLIDIYIIAVNLPHRPAIIVYIHYYDPHRLFKDQGGGELLGFGSEGLPLLGAIDAI
jgi:hypothetical protein